MIIPFMALPEEEYFADPDDLKDRVMKVLSELDESKYDEFKGLFTDEEGMKRLVDHMDASEEVKKKMLENTSESDLDTRCREFFNDLLDEGREAGINWSNVSFVDFLYGVERYNGLEQLEGELFFSSGDSIYSVQLMADSLEGKFYASEVELLSTIGRIERMHKDTPVIPTLEQIPVEDPISDLYNTNREPDALEYEPDILAHFPEGDEALEVFISENLVYPTSSIQHHEQGRVYVQFVIEEDGTITNPSVVRGASSTLDKEALRVVQSMPGWWPAEKGGKAVRTSYVLPIVFVLDEEVRYKHDDDYRFYKD